MENKSRKTDSDRKWITLNASLSLYRRDSAGKLVDEGGEQFVRGRAIVFNSPSVPLYQDENVEAREIIASEAVTKELLDASDIKLTLYHDRTRLIGRSKYGKGDLKYTVGKDGVDFECPVPDTETGREAAELVQRGIIDGCSFMFAIYDPESSVERKVEADKTSGRTKVTYIVRHIDRIMDMTLTTDPAYESTECEALKRDALSLIAARGCRAWREQVADMRRQAKIRI